MPQSGGFNQPLPDYCESDESPNAVNIDENHDQLIESNSASANAGDESSRLPAMGPCDLGALKELAFQVVHFQIRTNSRFLRNLTNHKGTSSLQFQKVGS